MNNKLKKLLLILFIPMALGIFAGCSSDAEPEKQETDKQEAAEMQEAWGEDWGYLSDEELANLPDPTEMPPLEVDGGMHREIGMMTRGEIRTFEISLKNPSTEAWKIQEINTNCDCTNVDGIPGGILLKPGQSWQMRIRVDSNRLPTGKFSREIIILPLLYLPVRIKVSGEVKDFATFSPENKTLKFPSMQRPDEKWSLTGQIRILPDAGPVKLVAENNPKGYIETSLQEKEQGVWEVKVSPRRPLPYGSFSEKAVIKAIGDKTYPDSFFKVTGSCGVAFKFRHGKINFENMNHTEDGKSHVSTYIGFDPYAADFTDAQMRAMQFMQENVDFDDFKQKVTFKAPEGVTVTETKDRHQIRIDVTLDTAMLQNTTRDVVITAEAYGSKVCELHLRPENKNKRFRERRAAIRARQNTAPANTGEEK